MSAFRPAWSEPFHAGAVPGAALRIPGAIDRRWAFGDGTGRGVRVAVVDSGVEAGHPMVGAVAQAVSVEADASAEDGVRFVEGPHDDVFGHGTACAGIIRSIAPQVELVSVRVLGGQLKGSTLAFAAGLDWCIEHEIDVVNLSLSTANEKWGETFWDLVDNAAHRGVLIVSAMNNERKRTIPSEFAGVFSVACAPGSDRESWWWNGHGPAEWGAAGIDVEVAWTGGGTLTASGNSFAAPVIAGHLARLRGAHPDLRVWQAKTVMAELAENTLAAC